MKRFKLNTIEEDSYPISRDEFEARTLKSKKYNRKGKDGVHRQFAVCPMCSNPIQIIGLYAREGSEKNPYGKHYCRSVDGLARHNEETYAFCPYASHNYTPPSKDKLRKNIGQKELDNYYYIRSHLNEAVYLIEEKTGLYVSEALAKELIKSYVGARGHMYFWSEKYNAPWVLMYLSPAFNFWGRKIRKESELYKWAKSFNDTYLKDIDEGYSSFKPDENRNIRFVCAFFRHRRKAVDHDMEESINMQILLLTTGRDRAQQSKKLFSQTILIGINEFPELIRSKKLAGYRPFLNQMAKDMMPELKLP